MKNLPSIGIAIVAVGIIGAVIYSNSGNSPSGTNSATETSTSVQTEGTDPTSTTDAEKKVAVTGSYVDYSDTVISSTQGTKILFFHAPWCPQCRALDASIKSGSVPTGVTIIKTDYDTNQELRKKYGVTIQTTLVKINDDGSFIKKYTAYDAPTLQSVKDNLL